MSDDTPRVYDETVGSTADLAAVERVVLHAERLVPHVERVRDRVARISRRVVVERRTIEVELRHEELVVDYVPGDGTPLGDVASEPIRITLHAEEPVVGVRVRAVEDVEIFVRRIVESRRIVDSVRHEVLDESFEPPGVVRQTEDRSRLP